MDVLLYTASLTFTLTVVSPAHLASLANRVWDVISQKPRTLPEVYRQCSACELKGYQVVDELYRSKQLATV
jgi:hypothetical protein